MASAPPPYTEQYQANPPVNPNYPAGGYPPQPGYPPQQPQPGYPPQQPQPGYPPAQYPPQQPQPGYPPQKPQPGYPPAQYPPQQVAAPPQPQQQGQQTIVITTQPPATGNCPICRAGMVSEDFTCCGICLAIFCFPLGLICCFLMRERHCNRCGARV